MSELLKKEFRALRPMALLIVAFYVALFIYGMADSLPDLPEETSRDAETMSLLVLTGLFASMTGAGLLVSESSEGTLRFLDSLPVSRTHIFFAKIAAGIAVLQLSLLLGNGLDTFSFFAERQSTTSAIHWEPIAVWDLQQSVVAIYILSVAVLLSFFRQWFTLFAGFIFWGFLWLRMNHVAWSALFDPYELLTYSGDDTHARFPWRHAAAALGVSAVCLAGSWLGFQFLGDRIQHTADRVGRWRFARLLRFLGIGLVPVVWLGVLYSLGKMMSPDAQNAGSAKGGEKFFGSEQTRRYDFVFRANQRRDAANLIASADDIHDKVMAFLGAEPVPGRIVADLGSPVIAHTAGLTNWTKIRVPLSLGLTLHELQAILGHETTHVYIEQLSAGAMGRHFDNARFFHEGLATFVEHRFFSTEEECQGMRRLAAAAASRGKVPFDILVSDEALSKERDGNLVYPLGEIFCNALVATCGETAPGKLLRAFARPGAPEGLAGIGFWRDATQSCGFSLDRVTAAYDADLDLAMKENADFIATFPKLTARVEVVGGEIVIRPQFEGTPPGKIVCMLEPVFGLSVVPAGKDGNFHVQRSQHPGPKLRYTLGWSTPDLRWPLFEKWADAEL